MRSTLSARDGWLFLTAVFLIGAYLYHAIDVSGVATDTREVGHSNDLLALADRDDLNVLFVLVDTLRADRIGAYGYERPTTPFLDELAARGVRFDRHLAQSSWTKTSMASMWSGLYPLRIGVTKFDHVLGEEAQLPAEILADAGFRTVGIYRNGWVNGYFGFDQGFDRYYRPIGRVSAPDVQRLRPNELAHGGDEDLIEDAIEFLRINGKQQPWFLYLHLMDLHEYAYDAESALFGSAPSDIYDNSLRRTDWLLSRLHDFLATRDLLSDTIFVVLSDHGEAFGERGFEGHARAVFPETTRTPLLVGLPFKLEPGVVVEEPTMNVDVWPTILDLVGRDFPGERDGRSRVPALVRAIDGARDEDATEDDVPESHFAFLDENWGRPDTMRKPAISVVEGPYRFVSGTDPSAAPFEVLLAEEDGFRVNRIAELPEMAGRLREQARDHLELEALVATEVLELDEMQLDQLRALGYELP